MVWLATDGPCELPSGTITFPRTGICRDLHTCDLVEALLLLLQSTGLEIAMAWHSVFCSHEAWYWASLCAITSAISSAQRGVERWHASFDVPLLALPGASH